LRLQLFPEGDEAPYSGLGYHGGAPLPAAQDRWSMPFGGNWGPASGVVPLHGAGLGEGLGAVKQAFDYGYGAGTWDDYASYGDAMQANEWAAYGAYGHGAGTEYPQTGYEFEGSGAALAEGGTTGFLSATAAEFMPGGWISDGQLPQAGNVPEDHSLDPSGMCVSEEQAAKQEPVASLMDPELPDPGLGRASTVRRGGGLDGHQGQAWGNLGGSGAQSRTLLVRDLEQWMTEGYISDLFADMALVTNVKVTRERKSGFSTGCAFAELASHSAAIGVLEALGGEPIVAKDGRRLRVSLSNSEAPSAETGREWQASWDAGAQGRGAEGRGEGRGERRARRERDRGEGRGVASRGEGGGQAESSGGRRGRRGDGAGRDARPEIEGAPQRRRGGDSRAEAHAEHRGESGRGAGGARPGRGPEDGPGGEVCWAYVDPNDQVQVGFTSDEMRHWQELGYFSGDLQLALMRCSPARAKYLALPPAREFYPLQEWFPDLRRSFTYIPRF